MNYKKLIQDLNALCRDENDELDTVWYADEIEAVDNRIQELVDGGMDYNDAVQLVALDY